MMHRFTNVKLLFFQFQWRLQGTFPHSPWTSQLNTEQTYTNFIGDNQTPPTPRINISRTNNEVELPEVAEKNLSIMEKKNGRW